MTERLRFVIAGFFVGLAELLPGISGSTVAIAFKVYEKFILFENFITLIMIDKEIDTNYNVQN